MRRFFTLALGYILFELLALVLLVAAAALVGVRYLPNGGYCAQRQALEPLGCRYEQSSDQPGEEVCR